MRILIIEDEHRAASQLQNLLGACNLAYELLGIIDSVEDAIAWFRNNPEADLVFMDIQLADGLSFEIFQSVKVESPIIFTTAFDQYAIQAFKVNSIDYLLKPIKQVDLQAALNKFSKTNQSNNVSEDLITQLLSGIQKPKSRTGILVKEGGGFVQIKLSDILYFYSEDSITFAVSDQKRYIVDETLDQLFSTLSSDQFFRINRGQIVSKDATQKIEPYFNQRIKLTVLNAKELEFIVSRQKGTEFKKWMNS